MVQKIKDLMTRQPVSLDRNATVREAAAAMKREDIGDVVVTEGDRVHGIVTDRDIVVRAVAAGANPDEMKLSEIASTDLVSVSADDDVEAAIAAVRDRAIRRVPVTEDGRTIGVLSMGDLAVQRDPESALADVSAAPPNE